MKSLLIRFCFVFLAATSLIALPACNQGGENAEATDTLAVDTMAVMPMDTAMTDTLADTTAADTAAQQ